MVFVRARKSVVVTTVLLGLLFSCNSIEAKGQTVAFKKKQYTITIGQKKNLKKCIKPKNNRTIIWKSKNAKTVMVNKKGVVTGRKKGNAVLVAKVKGQKKVAKCTIHVIARKQAMQENGSTNKSGAMISGGSAGGNQNKSESSTDTTKEDEGKWNPYW